MRGLKTVITAILLCSFFMPLITCSRQSVKHPYSSPPDVSEPISLALPGNKTVNYGEMADFLHNLMEEYRIRAMSISVSQNRQTFLISLGYIDPESQNPVNNNTVFQAGSLGQPVFASLVIKMWMEGIIDLDQPVYKYLKNPLPEYPEYQDLKYDPRYRRLTARKILCHQSGRGKHFGYSVEGYLLLQFVLEELTGRSINDLAKEKIFDRLGMRHSSLVWERRFEKNHAISRDAPLNSGVNASDEKASVGDFFLTTSSDSQKFLSVRPFGGPPEISITSKSIFSPPKAGKGISRPKNFSWSLGWGYYLHRSQHVNYQGCREKEYENYASAFYSFRGPAYIVILSVTSNKRTFTARILEELMGDTAAPLDWLDFEQKYRGEWKLDYLRGPR